MPDQPHYECDRCGLCCRKLIVEITQADVDREPRLQGHATPLLAGWPHVESEGERPYRLACSEPCALLGTDSLCGVYLTRPDVCRSFAAGSEQCQDLRELAGLPALESDEKGGIKG